MATRYGGADVNDVYGLQPLCRACLKRYGPEALCHRQCLHRGKHKRSPMLQATIVHENDVILKEVRGSSGRPVCVACFTNLPLLLLNKFKSSVCFGEHGPGYKEGFVWMRKDPPHTIIRPTPFNVGRMIEKRLNYRFTHTYQDCNRSPRNTCIFPHNGNECKVWNSWKRKSIDEISLTKIAKEMIISDKLRKVSKSVPHTRPGGTVMQPERCSVFGETGTAKLPDNLPSLTGSVSVNNYKTWFRTLLFHEMKCIKERMDRLHLKGPFAVKSKSFQWGHCQMTFSLTDDDAEFIKQSAINVKIFANGCLLSAVPINASNGLVVRVLPHDQGVMREHLAQVHEGTWIHLSFTPDFTAYWMTLHAAVEKLQPFIVSLLLPTAHELLATAPPAIAHGEANFINKEKVLELDGLFQTDALTAVLRCPPGPPFLLTGPFGTGKTRLIARLAHQILSTHRDAHVLICVHHIPTANSYVDSFFSKIGNSTIYVPVRLLNLGEQKPSEFKFTPDTMAKDKFYKRVEEIRGQNVRLIITTNTAAKQLWSIAKYNSGYFTHILIDEAAQCTEPEASVSLVLAGPKTKIVLAGDHLQVGPEDWVRSTEGKEKGLSISLLRRLHMLYCQIEEAIGVTDNPYIKQFTANLLSNYRCAPGILRLPSNLFYESSLLPQVTYKQHPDFSYPLVFVCTSMDVHGEVDLEAEVRAMIETTSMIIEHWPDEWRDYGDDNAICLMARTYKEISMIRSEKSKANLYSNKISVTEKTTFNIQGSEFTAVLLCTANCRDPTNFGRSIANPRVFNTVLTRSRALFVAFGNPFHLLAMEKRLQATHCWREYLKKCVESNSIVFPEVTKTCSKDHLFEKVFEPTPTPRQQDAILDSYERDFRRRLDFARGHWKLVEFAGAEVVHMNEGPSHPSKPLYTLECLATREAEAIPVSGGGTKFLISGIKARKHALHGATIEIEPLSQSARPSSKPQQARVTRLVEQSTQTLFLCKMDPFNSSLFIPLDGRGPKLVNLPPISRRLLQDAKAVETTLNNKKNPVACFDALGLGKGIPRLKDIIPFEAAKDLIFLVRFVEWRKKAIYPMAVVIDVFPAAHTQFHAKRMLFALHADIITDPPELETPPPPRYHTGDLHPIQAITIDTSGSLVMDDALSVQPAASTRGCYDFMVHITNVCSHLTKDQMREVVGRGCAAFLDKSTFASRLFPQNFMDACSLSRGKTYSCISLIGRARLDGVRAEVLEGCTIRKHTVKITESFTYEDAHRKLSESLNFERQSQLKLLFYISKALRRKRLGLQPSWYIRIHDDGKTTEVGPCAMVEEFMIWANSNIAIVLQQSGSLIPIRCQLPPSEQSQAELDAQILETRRAFFSPASSSRLSIPLPLVEAYLRTRPNDKLVAANLLSTAESYPQLVVKAYKEQMCSQSANYTVVEAGCRDIPTHNTIGNVYTHFTSPLWRGFDLMVQWILLAVMEFVPQNISLDEAVALAKTCKQKDVIAKKFQTQYERVVKAVDCFHNLYSSLAVVVSSKSNEKDLVLKMPIGPMAKEIFPLSFTDLAVKSLDECKVTWKFKLYSVDPIKSVILHGIERRSEEEVVIYKVPVREDPSRKLKREAWSLEHLTPQISATLLTCYFAQNSDIAEMELRTQLSRLYCNHVKNKPYEISGTEASFVQIEATRRLGEGDMLPTWVGCNRSGPTISSEIHLVQPVPFLNVCVHHIKYASKCFSNPILCNASIDKYSSVQQYVNMWEEVLLAEAAENAPTDHRNEHIYFQNAALVWPPLKKANMATEEPHYVPQGEISLTIPKEVLDRAQLFILPETGDFLCAQYDVPLDRAPGIVLNIYSAPPTARAVYHFVVTSKERKGTAKDKDVEIKMEITGKLNAMVSSMMHPFLSREDPPHCTLQLVPNSVSMRRLYSALRSILLTENSLLKSIVLGNVNVLTSASINGALSDVLKDPLVHQLWSRSRKTRRLNTEQRLAISRALQNSFYLVQGPPGTGKSETGAHLAYAFVRHNHITKNGKCVLYCGPSNKAVNVVLEKFHSLLKTSQTQKLKVLRIYSRAGELTGRTGPNNLPELFTPIHVEKCPQYLAHYTLHQKVLDGKYGDEIRRHEENFAEKACRSEIVNEEEKTCYHKVRKQAEDEVLQENYDVILCTCNEAAGERIAQLHERVMQCIIDESGMATEVECIAAMQHATQVVLIGDHKQLQPVILNKSAEENGLGRSLFERYADICKKRGMDSDDAGCFICLKVQYRMHRELCKFPSDSFYGRSLKSAEQINGAYDKFCQVYPRFKPFWPRPTIPTVFYDVKDGTESFVGSMDKAKLESKCNTKEANKVIKIAEQLVTTVGIDPQEIAVLTPYNAQKDCISNGVDKKGCLKGIRVQSINESQGSEFPIVILSLVRTMKDEDFDPKLVRHDKSWLNEHIGFVTNPHQICVGITRSRFGLIIVGNSRLLSCDETWHKLIIHYTDRGCIRH